jgi:hypothetical protein
MHDIFEENVLTRLNAKHVLTKSKKVSKSLALPFVTKYFKISVCGFCLNRS